ncbi:hypothetical protein CARUB_v10027443mg [Capsella rubella]|uniref:Uncharacterized protein n=1 Tax=Capsella rubella TaxID=81985 RepID=R0EYB2_9BRAS|nr:hypothetical protein CARUB_v10027443mg [Capsella rubella]
MMNARPIKRYSTTVSRNSSTHVLFSLSTSSFLIPLTSRHRVRSNRHLTLITNNVSNINSPSRSPPPSKLASFTPITARSNITRNQIITITTSNLV